MVFRKYKEVTQWGKMDTRIFKEILNSRNNRKMPSFRIPDAVKALGVEVHNPNHPSFFTPIFMNHKAFITEQSSTLKLKAVEKESHPLYKPIPCKLFDGSEAMSDGMAQACVLSKALLREGLPEQVLALGSTIDVHEQAIRDAILHGEKYDPTLEKLPRRFDPVLFWVNHIRVHGTPVVKRNNIILNNLYRIVLLSGIHNGKITEHMRCDRDEPLSGTIASPPYFDSSPFVLRFQPHLTIQTEKPVKAWASSEQVKATCDESIPSVAPLSPLIDLGSDHIYNDESVISRVELPLSLHTLLWTREQDQKYPWTVEQNAANAILHTFGAAVSEAKRSKKRDLEKDPVMVKGVQLVDGKLDMVAFQLNTLDLSEENPVKNIVWIEKAARLYRPKPYYEQMEDVVDLNMETVAKFVALMLSR